MKSVKYRIKGIAKTNMDKIEFKMKGFMASNRKILDAKKSKIAYTSVGIASV